MIFCLIILVDLNYNCIANYLDEYSTTLLGVKAFNGIIQNKVRCQMNNYLTC